MPAANKLLANKDRILRMEFFLPTKWEARPHGVVANKGIATLDL
jgi:hypothetical protein